MKMKKIIIINFDNCESGMRLNKLGHTERLVRSMPQLVNNCNGKQEYLLFFKSCPLSSLTAGTVTIGNKKIGRLSVEDQYTQMVKIIKQRLKYHTEYRYYFTSELQKNGNLHLHAIYYNMYQKVHNDAFGGIGSRNKLNISFQPIKNLIQYWKYIHKDHDKLFFPPIHNIKKRDYIEHYLIEEESSGSEKEDYNEEIAVGEDTC